MSIYKKLNEFHKEVGSIRKDAANPFHKSKYATIESVLKTIAEPMQKVGLGFTQLPQADGLKTIIFDVNAKDDANSMIESFVPYILAKDDMQGLGSAITYCRRYALVSMLGLEQEDDDANATIRKPRQAPKKPSTPQNLSEVMTAQGINKKAFYDMFGIDTAEKAQQVFDDKAGLNEMIMKFKESK